MSGAHPDDRAFLDGLSWETELLRRYCDRCEHQAPTVSVGHIEGGSGPGYEIRNCRECIALYLARARKLAMKARAVFVPTLPLQGDR